MLAVAPDEDGGRLGTQHAPPRGGHRPRPPLPGPAAARRGRILLRLPRQGGAGFARGRRRAQADAHPRARAGGRRAARDGHHAPARPSQHPTAHPRRDRGRTASAVHLLRHRLARPHPPPGWRGRPEAMPHGLPGVPGGNRAGPMRRETRRQGVHADAAPRHRRPAVPRVGARARPGNRALRRQAGQRPVGIGHGPRGGARRRFSRGAHGLWLIENSNPRGENPPGGAPGPGARRAREHRAVQGARALGLPQRRDDRRRGVRRVEPGMRALLAHRGGTIAVRVRDGGDGG
mmetsp:Transcript_5046/g.23221  ORF Transcript_5046/g.23221 Transcript_5046/m.23221 type:complete len:290 (-) Transcript_5046:33-902(-)